MFAQKAIFSRRVSSPIVSILQLDVVVDGKLSENGKCFVFYSFFSTTSRCTHNVFKKRYSCGFVLATVIPIDCGTLSLHEYYFEAISLH